MKKLDDSGKERKYTMTELRLVRKTLALCSIIHRGVLANPPLTNFLNSGTGLAANARL